MKSPNKGASCVQQRQRKRLQIEPADSFGVVRIEAMPLDAVLSESAQVPIALSVRVATLYGVTCMAGRPLEGSLIVRRRRAGNAARARGYATLPKAAHS